jgi:hypothetical protein
MTSKRMTRIKALHFAIAELEAIAGGADPDYADGCFCAAAVLEGMLTSLIKERDRKMEAHDVAQSNR